MKASDLKIKIENLKNDLKKTEKAYELNSKKTLELWELQQQEKDQEKNSDAFDKCRKDSYDFYEKIYHLKWEIEKEEKKIELKKFKNWFIKPIIFSFSIILSFIILLAPYFALYFIGKTFINDSTVNNNNDVSHFDNLDIFTSFTGTFTLIITVPIILLWFAYFFEFEPFDWSEGISTLVIWEWLIITTILIILGVGTLWYFIGQTFISSNYAIWLWIFTISSTLLTFTCFSPLIYKALLFFLD